MSTTQKPLIDFQKNNLVKLYHFMKSLPEGYKNFNMSYFNEYGRPPYYSSNINECGTSACLAGHGPKAGIEAEGLEHWTQYVSRVFCEVWDEFDIDFSPAYALLFSDIWDDNINNAIMRLEYFILNDFVVEEYIADSDVRKCDKYGMIHFNIQSLKESGATIPTITGEQL